MDTKLVTYSRKVLVLILPISKKKVLLLTKGLIYNIYQMPQKLYT